MSVANSDSLLVSAGATDDRTFSGGIGGGSAIGNGTQTVQAHRSTLIGTQSVRALFRATVVIDVNLAQGQSLDAVAAYAAMVAFAETAKINQAVPNSILSLFDPGNAYSAPTDWDISLLRTLYAMPHDRAGWKQRRMLASAIVATADDADDPQLAGPHPWRLPQQRELFSPPPPSVRSRRRSNARGRRAHRCARHRRPSGTASSSRPS